jgi:recombination protein RecA
MFGNPETTTGGKALKFYASIRLDVRRIETLKDGADITGYRARVKVVKNKMASPFKTAEFDFLAGEGISRVREVIDLGVTVGVVRKSGAWYTYGPLQLGQGKDKAVQYLREHPETALEIEARVSSGDGSTAVLPVDTRAPWETDGAPAKT